MDDGLNAGQLWVFDWVNLLWGFLHKHGYPVKLLNTEGEIVDGEKETDMMTLISYDNTTLTVRSGSLYVFYH